MQIFKRYKTLWVMGVIIVLVILFITNFNYVVDGARFLLNSFSSLAGGAALAFILNLIMSPVEKKLRESGNEFLEKRARSLAIAISFLAALGIIVLILSIVIPNLVSAVRMLTSEAPMYFKELTDLLQKLLQKFPQASHYLEGAQFDWNATLDSIVHFITKGSTDGNMMDNTFNLVSSAVGSVVNLFVMVVFASYVLSDKERFVKAYYQLTDLFMAPERRVHLTRNLRIINQSFKSFILGEILEACILTTMCIVGMLILRLPYATMIGILVGVINMIPMIGAFIGGGIGAFIIFTISPTKCLIFLIFLCVIQQIESNIFFPRVIGNKVGLPGIYVMMTIVVGGTLFGVLGMILGVPLMASLYKILKDYLAEVKAMRAKRLEEGGEARIHPDGTVSLKTSQPGTAKVVQEARDVADETEKLFHFDTLDPDASKEEAKK